MRRISAKFELITPCFESQPGDSPLDKALSERNIESLEKQYNAFSGDVNKFFEFSALARFIKTLGNDPKKDLEVLNWLYDKGISNADPSFIEAVLSFVCSRVQEKGIPQIQWCLAKIDAKEGSWAIKRCFENLSSKDIQVMRCFLDSGVCIPRNSLTTLFRNAVLDVELPTMNLIWEKCKTSYPQIHLEFLKELLNPNIIEDLTPSVFLDWVYDALLFFHGTSHTLLDKAELRFVDLKVAERLFSEMEKRGMGWERLRENRGDFECLTLKIDFAETFQTMSPHGLSFFEWAYNEKSETLSSHTFHWAFLKAAINGEVGMPLLKSLCESRGKKISYWCFKQAIHLAQKNKHMATAEWLEYQMKRYYPDGASALSDSDIQLLLASSHTPSGYRPLGDAPKRFGWKPLTVEELIKWDGKDPIEQKEDVQIPDRETELFEQFYSLIKRGKTAIQVTGTNEYKEKIYGLFQELLKYPSGRWTLLLVSRFPYKIGICEESIYDSTAHYNPSTRTITYKMPVQQLVCRQNKMGEMEFQPIDPAADLLHEFIHALHHYQQPELTERIQAIRSSDYSYTHLEEQRTISGIDAEFDLEAFALCENTFRCESRREERNCHQEVRSSR